VTSGVRKPGPKKISKLFLAYRASKKDDSNICIFCDEPFTAATGGFLLLGVERVGAHRGCLFHHGYRDANPIWVPPKTGGLPLVSRSERKVNNYLRKMKLED